MHYSDEERKLIASQLTAYQNSIRVLTREKTSRKCISMMQLYKCKIFVNKIQVDFEILITICETISE